MIDKRSLLPIAAAAALTIGGWWSMSPAQAGSLPVAPIAGIGSPGVELVHGWHRDCRWGPVRRWWHRHTDYGPVPCKRRKRRWHEDDHGYGDHDDDDRPRCVRRRFCDDWGCEIRVICDRY